MALPSLKTEMDRVCSLLSNAQGAIPELPNARKAAIAAELGRLALFLEESIREWQAGETVSAPAGVETERGLAGAERGQESWLERALSEARMGAWQWDLVTGQIQWTSGMYELYGLEPEQGPIGHDEFIAMIHPDDQQKVRDEFAEAAQRNGLFSHEFRFTCPNGTVLWVQSAGAVEADEAGKVIRIGGINQDITFRKLAEEALRKSRERERLRAAELQALMDAVPAIIWIAKDPQGREIEGNRYGYEYLQMPEGANLSKTAEDQEAVDLQPYYQVENGQRVPEDRLPMQIAATTGKAVREHEIHILFRDGTLKSAFGNAVPILDAEGKPAGAVGAFLDITDRKRAEDALRESQKRIAQLVETSFEGIWSVDAQGITTFVNPRAAEILGYTVEEIEGQNAFLFLMAGDVEAGRETLARIARGESGRVEAHAQRKNGEEAWLLVSFSPLLSEQGEFQGALAMFTDITGRKRIEDALARTAQELQEAQRIAHIGSWYWQADTDETTGSDELYRIYGLNPRRDRFPDFKQQRGTLYPEDVWDRLNQAVRQTVHTGMGYELDVPALRGGEPIWITTRSEAVCDSQGKLIGLRGTVQDITERKRAEEALRESEARFHASIESLPQSFAIYSAVREPAADGGRGKATDLRFEYANEAACRLNHLTRAQMIGHTLGELPGEHPLRDMMPRYLEVVETGESLVDAGYRFQDADGAGPDKERVHYVRASKLGDGLVVVRDDVTQQVRVENERREALTRLEIQQRLVEQSERERQAYAREIHDGPIQTLAALGLNIAFIEDAFPDPALRVELEQIGLAVKTAGRELRQVINEMRPPSPLRLGLSKAIEFHLQALRERSPQIRWELQLAPDPGLLTEPARLALFRIYQEATTNVIRHSQATRAWVRFQVRRNAVVLEVRDNGRGMEPEQEVEGHHGEYHFGLTGMRERAEAIGGRLEIEAAPWEGTRIRVTMPVAREG